VEELYQRIGKPQRLPVKRLDEQTPGPEAPQYCVPPASIVISAEDVTEADITIADFGEAFLCQTGSRLDVKLRTPLLLLPPEFIFHEGVNQAADMWTVASTLYEILGNRPLFEGFVVDENHVVAEMISTVGRLPEHWWSGWRARGDYFLPDGSWDTNTTKIHEPRYRRLAERLRIMGRGDGTTSDDGTISVNFTAQELVAIQDLLSSMLTYDPTRRITAEEALESRWMTQYGLPAIENLSATPPIV
jgi:serine/threonine-protein kinase SRPK3